MLNGDEQMQPAQQAPAQQQQQGADARTMEISNEHIARAAYLCGIFNVNVPMDFNDEQARGFFMNVARLLNWTGHMASTKINELEAQKNGAYEERNRVVAALARHYPSGVAKTAIEGWNPEWHNCVYIDTPEGQLSWHFHDSQAHLFQQLPPYDKPWDGHTTPEKYERLEALAQERSSLQ